MAVFLLLTIFIITLIIAASCAVKPHPNEKRIEGKWKPLKIERIVDSSAIQAAAHAGGTNPPKESKTGKPTRSGGDPKRAANAERLYQTEMRSTLEIFPDKTAIKSYPGKDIKLTWKMKSNGTRLVAKNPENKAKFVIDIEDISDTKIIVIEHAQIGDIRITYAKIQQ